SDRRIGTGRRGEDDACRERVDQRRIGRDRGPFLDGASDDFVLCEQALTAGIDQPFTELVEVENARKQNEKPRHVEGDDAAGEACEAAPCEKAAKSNKPCAKRCNKARAEPILRGGSGAKCRIFIRFPPGLLVGQARHAFFTDSEQELSLGLSPEWPDVSFPGSDSRRHKAFRLRR